MRKIRIGLVALAAAGLMVGMVGGEAVAGKKKATVKLGDNFFKPRAKTVKKGTKVRFKWIGSNPHNVVKNSGPGKKFGSTTTSAKGVNFKKKFKKQGTYQIICTIHQPEMDFTLTVK